MHSRLPQLVDQFFGKPWLLTESKGVEIAHVLAERLRDPAAVAELARVQTEPAAAPPPRSFQIVGSVAVLPVFGLISKRMNLVAAVSGGTSTDLLKRDLAELVANPMVRAIVLDVDSPGGSVHGPFEVSDAIFQARGAKPIVAVANETADSAAYLIASAADLVVATSSAELGSIGVVTAHVDFSEQNRQLGIKVTVFRLGALKAKPDSNEPLDAAGRGAVMEGIEEFYRLFVAHVARNRGVSEERALSEWASGQVWIGARAVELGLADRLGTLSGEVARLNERPVPFDPLPGAPEDLADAEEVCTVNVNC